MRPFTRRALLVAGSAGLGAVVTDSLHRGEPPAGRPFPLPVTPDPLVLNDASGLSPVKVARHITLKPDRAEATTARLRTELAAARQERRPLVVHAARHSMGAQSLAFGGTAVTMDGGGTVEIDTVQRRYRVDGGTRWRDVIAALDPKGFSPAVMQSNHDFGVAATFSVNAHGWPVPFSGGGTTVEAIEMLLADGTQVMASRSVNPELFRAALGGYGLIGIITGLEVAMVPNARLEPRFEVMPAAGFAPAFMAAVAPGSGVQMAYGRLSIARDGFFEEALLVTYRPTADQADLPPASGSGFVSRIARDIFRQQPGSDRWKKLRWGIEADLAPRVTGGIATRNSLMNEPVATLDDRDPARTDILHEYFIPPDRFSDFLAASREVMLTSYQELLNVTLRFVDTDRDSVLAYAPGPRIAAVLLFSQEKTERAERDMARMTTELIERVIAIGGSYYLPYRPHATLAQFRRAYPRHQDFVSLKQTVDPGFLLRNGLWENYLGRPERTA